MHTVKNLFSCLIIFCAVVYAPQALSQNNCDTAEYIDAINRGVAERVAHIEDESAILFFALDPAWSDPEFEYEGYRDLHFIASMKRARIELMYASIDEIIIWEIKQPKGLGLGSAVPFKLRCVVSGYGEPDYLNKLMLMHETFFLIKQYGIDNLTVREGIKKIIMSSTYSSSFNDSMIDAVINNLKVAKARIGKTKPTPEEIAILELDKKTEVNIMSELKCLEFAQNALARGDIEFAYRVLEDELVSEHTDVREKTRQFLEQHPELYRGALQTFSSKSLKESINKHGASAEEIESRRLSIYKKIAPDKDYTKALRYFESVFGSDS